MASKDRRREIEKILRVDGPSVLIDMVLDLEDVAERFRATQVSPPSAEPSTLTPTTVPTEAGPVSMVLACQKCGTLHVDVGEWATRPHRTHLCARCGVEWTPYPYATVGKEPSDA